jgi:hypothetical protein
LCFRQNENLDEVADSDRTDQEQNDGFNRAHSEALQSQQKQYVEAGDDDCPEHRNVEE